MAQVEKPAPVPTPAPVEKPAVAVAEEVPEKEEEEPAEVPAEAPSAAETAWGNLSGEASVIGRPLKSGDDDSSKFTEYREFNLVTGEWDNTENLTWLPVSGI
jgi:hypothetical protein